MPQGISVDTSILTRHQLPPLPRSVRTLTDDERARLMSQHPNLPPSPIDAPNTCITCAGRREFRWWEHDASGKRLDSTYIYECPCVDQWILHRYLLMHGIDKGYQRLDWNDYVERKPPEFIDWLLHAEGYINAGFGFVLSGAQGNGKTLLAVLALKALLAQGFDGHLTSFRGALDMLTASWRDKDDRRWFNHRIRNTGVLVIDDLGAENRAKGPVAGASETGVAYLAKEAPAFVASAFEEIIRHRVAAAKPTIITTNLSLDQLGHKYDTNVFSLLSERSEVIEFISADFRHSAYARSKFEVRTGLTRPLVMA